MQRSSSTICGALICLTIGLTAGQAQERGKLERANPNIQSDGTRSPAALRAMTRGPLPMNPAHEELKRQADRDHDAAVAAGRMRANGFRQPEAGAQAPTARAPAVVASLSFAGQSDPNSSPSDSTGTIGPTSYIQTVNTRVKIYDRTTHAAIASGTLNQLAGNAAGIDSFDPQIMWDPTTRRFYYLIDSVFSASHNKLAYGFSKTANPASISAADWCQYTLDYGSEFPDFPKLGDSRWFIIFGVNTFNSAGTVFHGSDIIAVEKPAAGTTCPAPGTLQIGSKTNIKDNANQQTFTPVPANQVDNNGVGFVVAMNGTLPSTKLWFYSVTRNGTTGAPVFGNARGVTVPTYTLPPNATEPDFTQKIDTSDARMTQAVQSVNPDRGTTQSFWTQHTVRHPTEARSIVRWYEINPSPATPVLLRTGVVGNRSVDAGIFFFNASISSDRAKNNAVAQFGNSLLINYNVSSRANGISPGIRAASSVAGGAMSFSTVRNGVHGYRDFTCPSAGDICRWGDYSSAMPDPVPTTTGRGEIWITNQYSGDTTPDTVNANWRTWIAAMQP
jgi:hypothetical protein